MSNKETYNWNELKSALPNYSPGEELWNSIEQGLDNPPEVYSFEENKNELNSYLPKDKIWDGIEDQLELDGHLNQLPTHSPKPEVWENIQKELEEVKGGIISMGMILKIAASFVVLLATIFLIDMQSSEAPLLAETKIEVNDNEEMALVEELCKDYKTICEAPAFKKLENQLGELNEHKKELMEMVSAYDDRSSYGPILAKIEMEKTEVLKQMIDMI